MKLKRRQALWGGLGATLAAIWGRNTLAMRAEKAEKAKLAELYDPQILVQQAYEADLKAVQKLAIGQRNVTLRPPTVAYNRTWSKQLIDASKLATLQYFQGKYQADYDGDITVLPFYPNSGFQDFQQVAAFKATEQVQERIRFAVPTAEVMAAMGDLADLQNRLNKTRDEIEQRVEQIVQISQAVKVYYGFLLTSDEYHLLVFRGTQRSFEMFKDLLTLQVPYQHPATEESLGLVHFGFWTLYFKQLAEAVREAVQGLDPSKPLVLTGHSLGGALANLAALDLVLRQPHWQSKVHVYTYGAPRVGDRTFAENHSQWVPNHYRIVNLADLVPMTPLSELLIVSFVHGGEPWSFLSQHGDVAPNHLVDVYRNAIAQEAETKENNQFVNLPIALME